jgi:large-conductance mechanosensitive channel
MAAVVLGAVVNLDSPAHYIHWGFFQMSLANFILIITMIVVFVLAILLPFPTRKRGRSK